VENQKRSLSERLNRSMARTSWRNAEAPKTPSTCQMDQPSYAWLWVSQRRRTRQTSRPRRFSSTTQRLFLKRASCPQPASALTTLESGKMSLGDSISKTTLLPQRTESLKLKTSSTSVVCFPQIPGSAWKRQSAFEAFNQPQGLEF